MNCAEDSLYESSTIAGRHEQLDLDERQDQELAFVECIAEAAQTAFGLVWSRDGLGAAPKR